jgi:hypothetical protein
MLLVSFKTCAAPGLSPAIVSVGPHSEISGRTWTTAAGPPYTITDNVPARVPAGPPEIGQSTIVMPFGPNAVSISRRNGTPTVQVLSSSLIAPPASSLRPEHLSARRYAIATLPARGRRCLCACSAHRYASP